MAELACHGDQDLGLVDLAVGVVGDGANAGEAAGGIGAHDPWGDDDAAVDGEGLEKIAVGDGVFHGPIGHGNQIAKRDVIGGIERHTKTSQVPSKEPSGNTGKSPKPLNVDVSYESGESDAGSSTWAEHNHTSIRRFCQASLAGI